MMFNKGDTVKLVGCHKSYTVLVTDGHGEKSRLFSGVITESEYDNDYLDGELSVGSYDTCYETAEFELVEGV